MTKTFDATRIYETPTSSVALWKGPGLVFPLYCLEPGEKRDPHHRIPAGTYALRLRTIGTKHKSYRDHYARSGFGPNWHKGMIEICDVPDREAIEFHVGNFIADTLGCSISGLSYGKGEDGNYQVVDSRIAYEKAYPIFRDAILAGPTQLIIHPAGSK